jgi:type 1 glutamine amidotransferase
MIKRLILLTVLLAGAAFAGPRVVFMIGEDEYHTWETLPDFVAKDLPGVGCRTTIINADATDKNNFPGLVEALKEADLLFVSVRRRTPPKEQLDAVRAHLAAGKPLVGIRTACHAFALREKDKLADPKLAAWQEFDPEVLGGHYTNHDKDGPKTAITVAPGAEAHAILRGIDVAKLVGNGSLYKVSPIEKDVAPLLLGTIPDQPAEPVAWTHLYGSNRARVFFTSLGHPDDFQNPEFRRLLVNGVAWALGK